MPAVSKKQQRFFGIVRAAQKGTLKGEKTLEVQRAAASMKKKDVKKFASTKHKGLPEKKVTKESFNEDYVKELEDGLVKMDYPSYDEVDKLMCKIAKENDIDTTTLHMAFKTKHLMVPDDWAKKKMFEPIMIPKTPEGLNMKEGSGDDKLKQAAKDNNLDLTNARDRRKAMSISRRIAMKGNVNNPDGPYKKGEKMYEGNLRDWFKGSKSKDGKGGWVNVVTGGTCASDKPGEGTPKCVSSKKRASMTKAERLSAQRRKKAADPGQQSKRNAAKPTYVSTDKKKAVKESLSLSMILELSDSKMQRQSDENLDALQKKFTDMSKDGSPSNKFMLNRVKREQKRRLQQKQKEAKRMAAQNNNPKAAQVIEDHMPEIQEDCWDGYEKKGMKTMFGKRYPNCVKKKRKKTRKEEFSPIVEGGCKVGKQYKRDDYGDIVGGPPISDKQRRINLAKNEKDEKITRSEAVNPQQAAIAIAKREKKERDMVAKKMKKEEVENINELKVPKGTKYEKMSYKKFKKTHKDFKSEGKPGKTLPRVTTLDKETGGTVSRPVKFVPEAKEKLVYGDFGNYTKNQKVDKKPKEKKLKEPPYEDLASDYAPDMSMVEAKSPAWQRKAGKSESGGLNAKGVASYRRANPGSKLKTAVTTKPSKLKKGSKSAKRRLSFCRRMKGMKKKLTSAKTARDPNSRINKSLRKWNCSFEPEHGEMISEYKTMLDTIKRKVSVLGGKSNKKPAKKTTGRDAGAIARKVLQQKQHNKYVNFLDIDEEKKKCGEGEYYCNDMKKCRPIPKGYRVGYGGMLRPEKDTDESNGKKGGSNGNGNGHGGNGNGHGGNGNGGNGGGNGGGE